MTSDFERAHAFTAAWEGAYSNHAADTGGETNFGVTRRVWEAWCRDRGLPVKPMRALSMADVLPLYQARYWDAYPYPSRLPWPLSAAIYDMAVNHGGGRTDGSNGAGGMLARAWARCPRQPPLAVALAACDEREAFYRAIVQARPSQGVFLRGWLRRVNAQRDWLRENASPLTPPRILLVNTAGGLTEWDGKPTVFGGENLTAELVSQLRIVYPTPGGPYSYPGLLVWQRKNGDMVLERAKTPSQTKEN